jgi:hypothetical protein
MVLHNIIIAIERLIVAVQAYPTLKAKANYPGTFSHTFTEISNEGAFRGFLKGLTFSALQFGLVLYPSVYLTNKKGGDNKYLYFLGSYSILDAILYPLDTVKNILFAETHG